MAIKKYKPVTPGQRNKAISSFDEITAKKPYKKLLAPLKSTGGRNNTGQMTVRYRGGGHKRMYRLVDFVRNRDEFKATAPITAPGWPKESSAPPAIISSTVTPSSGSSI